MDSKTGVRATDNSDEAEAAMGARGDAPALTLTGAELDKVRRALSWVDLYVASDARLSYSAKKRRVAADLLSDIAAARAIVDPQHGSNTS